MTDTSHDVLVIGSGAAGLTAALALAETKKVLKTLQKDPPSGPGQKPRATREEIWFMDRQ